MKATWNVRVLPLVLCLGLWVLGLEASLCNPDECKQAPCMESNPAGCSGAVRCEPNFCACTSTYYDSLGLRICEVSHGKASAEMRGPCDPPPPCAFPDCPAGEMYVPEGECCPKCSNIGKIDCAAVTCPAPHCPDGSEAYVPEGQCCSVCRSPIGHPKIDCRTVRCARPDCPAGYEEFRPHGACCGSCRPIETKVTCFPRLCNTVCIDGYDIDENGCNTCRCKSAIRRDVPCPPVCMIYCPYGNLHDVNGCPTCHCNSHPQILPQLSRRNRQ